MDVVGGVAGNGGLRAVVKAQSFHAKGVAPG